MIRNTLSILIASALAGCTVTSTPAGPDGGPGTDAAGLPDTGSKTDDSGTPPDAGSSTDSGRADVAIGDAATAGGCSFGEPNDTRETATPVDVNRSYTRLCLSNVDGTTDPSDFYVMTAPTDAAGGYVTFTISNVGTTGTVEALATAVADGAQMVDVTGSNDGATVTGWFTVSPGAQYRLELRRYPGAGETFAYDLQLAYTTVSDAYEPNNTRADAKAIALNTPVQASGVAFSANGALATADGDDWYRLTLAAGAATVKLTNAPADYTCDIQLFDSTNSAVANEVSATGPGANCEIDAMNVAAGVYTLDVRSYLTIDRAGSGAPPPSITADYTLAVTQ
jgi:hypothetical protein